MSAIDQQQLIIVQKLPKQNYLKAFLNGHSNLVDFLSSSLIICLCFIVLLPRVHDSFLMNGDVLVEELKIQHIETTTSSTLTNPSDQNGSQIIATETSLGQPDEHQHQHQHHHSHRFPTGEVLICAGFFIFYCIGLKLNETLPVDDAGETRSLLSKRAAASTVCCSSTRCPSSQPEPSSSDSGNNGNSHSHPSATTTTTSAPTATADTTVANALAPSRNHPTLETDCLLLLNRHHQHHTHARHHEHSTTNVASNGKTINTTAGSNIPTKQEASATRGNKAQANKPRSNYGSVSNNNNINNTTNVLSLDGKNLTPQPPVAAAASAAMATTTTILVDEIQITSPPVTTANKEANGLRWPRSLKMLLVSLFLASMIILFDMNILGLLKTLRVFRAASTGALLYIAFFIMLPRHSAGCNSCNDEEEEHDDDNNNYDIELNKSEVMRQK